MLKSYTNSYLVSSLGVELIKKLTNLGEKNNLMPSFILCTHLFFHHHFWLGSPSKFVPPPVSGALPNNSSVKGKMIGGWGGGEGRWDTLDHKVHKEEKKYPLPSGKWIWMVPKDGLIKGVIFKKLAQN
jgi:hypothetical protein